jgi:heme A synthase
LVIATLLTPVLTVVVGLGLSAASDGVPLRYWPVLAVGAWVSLVAVVLWERLRGRSRASNRG